MITKEDAIEEAARLLRHKERALINTYGGPTREAIELAKAWTNLAAVIGSEGDEHDAITKA